MKVINILRLLEKHTGGEVFLTGGFVRDFLRRKENPDIDVVIRNITLEKAMDFLKRYGRCKIITLAQSRETEPVRMLLFKPKDQTGSYNVQITLPRRGKVQIGRPSNSIKQDAKYRDFRFNALYLPVHFKTRKDVIDLFGGQKDIEQKLIAPITTPAECFSLSPVRMLRMVRFAATLGYRISLDLLKEVKNHAEKILTVPPEILREEFNKILLSPEPSRYLRLLQRLGLMRYLVPELDRCVGVKQDPHYHKYDVFTHSILTVDNLEPDLVLRLAGLLHDVGKTDTRKEIIKNGEKHVTFHKHEVESVKLAKIFLDRFRYNNRIKEQVLNLIGMHMYHYTREYSDAAVRKFVKRAGITPENICDLRNVPLFKLRAAERLGNGLKKEPITQRQIDFENRIKQLFECGGTLELSNLQINGDVIMSTFELPPGPLVGQVLSFLLDKVRSDTSLNNRLDLISLAAKFLKQEKKKEAENTNQNEAKSVVVLPVT